MRPGNLTKRQFCEAILKEYEIQEGEKPTENCIFKSGTLAVAMEFLGLIKTPRLQEYAASRGGIYELSNTKVTSVRDIISQLRE